MWTYEAFQSSAQNRAELAQALYALLARGTPHADTVPSVEALTAAAVVPINGERLMFQRQNRRTKWDALANYNERLRLQLCTEVIESWFVDEHCLDLYNASVLKRLRRDQDVRASCRVR